MSTNILKRKNFCSFMLDLIVTTMLEKLMAEMSIRFYRRKCLLFTKTFSTL